MRGQVAFSRTILLGCKLERRQGGIASLKTRLFIALEATIVTHRALLQSTKKHFNFFLRNVNKNLPQKIIIIKIKATRFFSI